MALAASLKPGALSDHHRLIRQFEAVPLMITSMAIPDRTTTENRSGAPLGSERPNTFNRVAKKPATNGTATVTQEPYFPDDA